MKMRLKNQRGFTMAELMVAVTIGIFLTGGTFKVFTSAKRSQQLQDNMATVQENGRFAMNFLTFDTRGAGYWGPCSDVAITNNLNSGTGVDDFSSTDTVVATDNIPTTTSAEGAMNTDAISLRSIDHQSPGIELTATMASNDASLTVASGHGLSKDDLVLVVKADCSAADIFQVTNNPTGGTISHAAGGGAPGNASAQLSTTYSSGDTIYPLRFITYSIRRNTVNSPHGLFRRVNNGIYQEVISAIDDMQIVYGEDNNDDNAVNYYVPIGSINNMAKVMSVRFSLTASTREEIAQHNPDPNGRGKLLRDFVATVAIRNRIR